MPDDDLASVPGAPRDALVRSLSASGGIAVRTLVATELVREAARRHQTSPTATAALGRTLMAALLLASDAKDRETVQLQIRGGGPLRAVTAIADSEGNVRGYAGDPSVDPPLRDGKLDVGGAIGPGVLSVVRFHPEWREPYSGIVPLATGEIAEDVAHYLRDSEQKPSAVALGVWTGPSGSVEAAGGFLVRALPGADDEELAVVEREVRALPPVSELVRAGSGAGELAQRLLAGLGARPLQQTTPRFFCGCTRDRVLRAMTLLGRPELRDVVREGEPLEVRCELCAARWVLSTEEIRSIALDA